MDMLHISDLKITTKIGVHAWEQRILQPLLLDIRIPIDASACNDQLKNTIDYDLLCQTITSLVESNTFALIETVAESVAQYVKDTFSIQQLTVRVSKPHAVANAGNVSITIER